MTYASAPRKSVPRLDFCYGIAFVGEEHTSTVIIMRGDMVTPG
jgi:hypothetical protein